MLSPAVAAEPLAPRCHFIRLELCKTHTALPHTVMRQSTSLMAAARPAPAASSALARADNAPFSLLAPLPGRCRRSTRGRCVRRVRARVCWAAWPGTKRLTRRRIALRPGASAAQAASCCFSCWRWRWRRCWRSWWAATAAGGWMPRLLRARRCSKRLDESERGTRLLRRLRRSRRVSKGMQRGPRSGRRTRA